MGCGDWSQGLAKYKEENLDNVVETLKVGKLGVLPKDLGYHV